MEHAIKSREKTFWVRKNGICQSIKTIPACSEKYNYGQSLGWSREFVTDELER